MEKFINSKWGLPLLTTFFCIFQICFVSSLSANNGFGWDGSRYADIIMNGMSSKEINSYMLFRVFPFLIIRSIFTIATIPFSPSNIIFAQKVLNSFCIVGAVFFLQQILEFYKLNFERKLFAFSLFIINFAILRFLFFYPILSDSFAFFLGTASLVFYLKEEKLNLILIAIIAAFSWPASFLQCLILIAFPVVKTEFKPLNIISKIGIYILFCFYAVIICIYLLKIKPSDVVILYATKIDRHLLFLSIFCLVVLFGFISSLFFNAVFFKKSYLLSCFKSLNIYISFFLLVFVIILRSCISELPKSEYTGLDHLINTHWIYALVEPLINIVNHFNFYGVLIPLTLIYWKRISRFSTQFGIGIPLALALNLILFGMKSESRVLMNIFPWLVILLVLSTSKIHFSKFFYVIIIFLNLLVSKCWFQLNFTDYTIPYLRSDELISWPYQQFYMHLGIYVLPQIWFYSLLFLLGILLILLLNLFKIQFQKKLLIYFKFKEEI